MSLIYQCDNCGASINAEPSWIGQQISCPNCQFNFELPMTAVTSGMVANDYWFQKCIGSGDIGEIFVVKKVKAQEKFFMKVLSPAVTQNLQVYNIFLSQVSQAMRIEHPNIVVTAEVGEINELKLEVQKLREAQAKSDKKNIDMMKKSRMFVNEI